LVLFCKKERLAFCCLPHRPGGSGKSHSHRNLVLQRAFHDGFAVSLLPFEAGNSDHTREQYAETGWFRHGCAIRSAGGS
jgi:hypothetical protein